MKWLDLNTGVWWLDLESSKFYAWATHEGWIDPPDDLNCGESKRRHGVTYCCEKPPRGWWCSRAAGHDGPCAAHPQKYRTKNRIRLRKHHQIVAEFMDEYCGGFVIHCQDGYQYYGEFRNEIGGITYGYSWVRCQNYQLSLGLLKRLWKWLWN